MVLLDNLGGPAQGALVFMAVEAREKVVLVIRLLCPGPISSWQADVLDV